MNNVVPIAKQVLHKVSKWAVKNSPSILTALGIVGFVGMGVLIAKESPKAKEEYEKAIEKKPDMNALDKAKVVAPYYWKPAVLCVVSGACVIFSNKVNLNRNAALLTAYKLSESTIKDFQESARKIVGKKDAEKIEERAAIEGANRVPYIENNVIRTGHGESPWFDAGSGRWFLCSGEWINQCETKAKALIWANERIGINDIYELIGLPITENSLDLGISMSDLGGYESYGCDYQRFDSEAHLIRAYSSNMSDLTPYMIMTFRVHDRVPTWNWDDGYIG